MPYTRIPFYKQAVYHEGTISFSNTENTRLETAQTEYSAEAETQRLMDHAYTTETMQYGGVEQTVYKVRTGDVWLGTWKTN